ncbi:hypothetical protein [Streptomyces violarus]|uniref:hypothetical protein n=1 Tax=Streptomyces violarus TaxID=67380 RepID=UPI0021C1864C|nr:hypothetical protein [Streptomyces violarus]MCT9144052.1 hypothetical protein [Streptomyces violarus]
MTNQQQQPVQEPKQPPQDPPREFAKKSALAAIGGACSGTARALWVHVFGDSS